MINNLITTPAAPCGYPYAAAFPVAVIGNAGAWPQGDLGLSVDTSTTRNESVHAGAFDTADMSVAFGTRGRTVALKSGRPPRGEPR